MGRGQYIEITQVIEEIRKVRKRLNTERTKLFDLAQEKAETERAYQVAKHQEILRLKSEGYAATLIPEMVRGSDNVSQKRFERDVAREKYTSGRDSVKLTMTESSLLQTISKYDVEG